MTRDSLGASAPQTRSAVVDLLFRMSDDAFLMGAADVSWAHQAPDVQASRGLVAMAVELTEHARVLYSFLHAMGQSEPRALATSRGPRRFRCAALAAVPVTDWADGLVRRFLYCAAADIRLSSLSQGGIRELVDLAHRLQDRRPSHFVQCRQWLLTLGRESEAHRQPLQRALSRAYPQAMAIFEVTEVAETLAQAGVCPHEDELLRQWESAVAPVLADVGLEPPVGCEATLGGRFGQHPAAFAAWLSAAQSSVPERW